MFDVRVMWLYKFIIASFHFGKCISVLVYVETLKGVRTFCKWIACLLLLLLDWTFSLNLIRIYSWDEHPYQVVQHINLVFCWNFSLFLQFKVWSLKYFCFFVFVFIKNLLCAVNVMVNVNDYEKRYTFIN